MQNFKRKVDFIATSKNALMPIIVAMKFLTGVVVTEMSGSQGGTVASKNRGGFYFRGKGAITNRNTAAQRLAREKFSISSASWKQLTQAQRLTWLTLAPTYNRINVFGQNRPLSGSQLYNRLNNNLQKIDQPMITDCPVPVQPPAIVMDTLTISIAGPDMDLAIPAAVPSGYTGYLSASPILSAGVSFNKNHYKFIKKLVLADTATISITTAYQSIYGGNWLLSQGSQIMLKLEIVENATGLPSSITYQSGIIGA